MHVVFKAFGSSAALVVCLGLFSAFSFAQFYGGTDRDLDNDGIWDYGRGGTDRDLDNDGRWDYGRGGTDRDLDNDGIWDY